MAAAAAVRIPDDLKRVDSARWCVDLLLDWAVIAAAMAGAIHAQHWIAWAAAVLVIGNRQHAQAARWKRVRPRSLGLRFGPRRA